MMTSHSQHDDVILIYIMKFLHNFVRTCSFVKQNLLIVSWMDGLMHQFVPRVDICDYYMGRDEPLEQVMLDTAPWLTALSKQTVAPNLNVGRPEKLLSYMYPLFMNWKFTQYLCCSRVFV